MEGKIFELIPFERNGSGDGFQIHGTLSRSDAVLSIAYVLDGPLDRLCIQAPVRHPLRRDRLWKATCFECFLGAAGVQRYWEFNFSPAGHWNVYAFDGYRRGMRPEPAFSGMQVSTQRTDASFRLNCAILLEPIGLAGQSIAVGLSAVLQYDETAHTHWALNHTGAVPDFHRREGFAFTF